MKSIRLIQSLLFALAVFWALPSLADSSAGDGGNEADFIIHHVVDGHELDFKPFGVIHLPRWNPIRIGSFEVDMSPTKHSVYLIINSIVLLVLVITAAAPYRKQKDGHFAPKGLSNLVEVFVVFIRDDVAKPNIGVDDYRRFTPFLLSVFFFILVSNLMGLIPFGTTITGNINVTATLAIFTFVVTHVSSRKTYWKHIFAPDVPFFVMFILIPVETLQIFTRPFALAVRLFANMTGGHLVIFTFIGLIFILNEVWYIVAPISIALTLFVNLLEIAIAIIQAYIFTILSAVYIGMAVEKDHH